MSNTVIKLNKELFTIETTQSFMKDLETACKTMESDLFVELFIKYDLYYNDEYKDTLDSIKDITGNWNKPELGTELREVSKFESRCLFCKIGKKVHGYKWTYTNKLDTIPKNRFIYQNQIAFIFEYESNKLVEFGICNGYIE